MFLISSFLKMQLQSNQLSNNLNRIFLHKKPDSSLMYLPKMFINFLKKFHKIALFILLIIATLWLLCFNKGKYNLNEENFEIDSESGQVLYYIHMFFHFKWVSWVCKFSMQWMYQFGTTRCQRRIFWIFVMAQLKYSTCNRMRTFSRLPRPKFIKIVFWHLIQIFSFSFHLIVWCSWWNNSIKMLILSAQIIQNFVSSNLIPFIQFLINTSR